MPTIVELYEDNAGHLYLRLDHRAVSDVETQIGYDALAMMGEYWQTAGDPDDWTLPECDPDSVDAHPETRLIARYGIAGLDFVGCGRPGNAGRAYLGPYAPAAE